MYGFIRAIIYKFRVMRTLLFTTLHCRHNSASHANTFIDDISIVDDCVAYYINATSEILASEGQVRNITDYDHIYHFSYSIIESKVFKSSDKDKVQIESLFLRHFLSYGNVIPRVQVAIELHSRFIQTRAISFYSNFSKLVAPALFCRNGLLFRLHY